MENFNGLLMYKLHHCCLLTVMQKNNQRNYLDSYFMHKNFLNIFVREES